MPKGNIKLIDESGDRDFFTIVPNFIINHSIATDRALYLEMKRFAGEDGECFATEKTMMRRLQIGKKAFDKSLKYLISRGWITFTGLTEGKTRPIKTYKINNVWQENSEYFKKISSESTLSFKKISSESKGDKSQKQHKISPESNVEEEPSKEDPLRRTTTTLSSVVGKEISEVIKEFEKINPSIGRLYGNKTQRGAVQRMLNQHGLDKILWAARTACAVAGKEYAPVITTPLQLESKLGQLIVYVKKESSKTSKVITV